MKIIVDLNDPADVAAFIKIVGGSQPRHPGSGVAFEGAVPTPPAPPAPTPIPLAAPAPSPLAAPAPVAPAAPTSPFPTAPVAPAAPAGATQNDIMQKTNEIVAKKGSPDAVLALLREFGINSFAELQPAMFDNFYAKLSAL